MTTPSEAKTWTKGRFPRTRAEAEEASHDIELHLMASGCVCKDVKIQFCKPPTSAGFVHVEHERHCPLVRQS